MENSYKASWFQKSISFNFMSRQKRLSIHNTWGTYNALQIATRFPCFVLPDQHCGKSLSPKISWVSKYKRSTRETIFRATVGTSLFVGPTNLDTIFTNPLTTLCPLLLKLVTCLLTKGFSRKQQRLFTVADFHNVTSVTFWTIYIDAADSTKISHQNITLQSRDSAYSSFPNWLASRKKILIILNIAKKSGIELLVELDQGGARYGFTSTFALRGVTKIIYQDAHSFNLQR